MDRWYVVYTQPRAEEKAMWHLANQGFRCFLPRFRRVKSHARRKEVCLEPLFPRYLFTRLDCATDAWRRVNGSQGVVHLLTQGSEPVPVATSLVEQLVSASDSSHATSLAAIGLLYKGRSVRIQDGPLAGQVGMIEQIGTSAAARVRLLMNFLGRSSHFDVPADALEPI